MNDDVDKLQVVARALRSKLSYYAQVDTDAQTLLKAMIPLFDKIERGEVVPPQRHRFRWHLIDPEAPLTKYDDLVDIGAEYAEALEKWDFKNPWDEWPSGEVYKTAGIAKNTMQTAARLLRGKLEDRAKTESDLRTALHAMTPWFDALNGINKLSARVVDNKLEYYVDPETEAHTILRTMAPWFDDVGGPDGVAPHQKDNFIWHLRSAESPLSKHDDLAQLGRECAAATEDWFRKARWDGWETPEDWQAAQLAKQKDGNEK